MKVKITNKLGLPESIVQAVMNDPYSSGGSDYTATGLLKPARMAQLEKTCEVTEDAADRLYSLQGQVMHTILQRAGEELLAQGFIVEKRFESEFVVDGRVYRVSAQVDLFDPATGTLSDYKYTSVAAAKHGLKPEHKMQLNLGAELLRRAGYSVNRLEIVALLRDWSVERTYKDYPTAPVMKQECPMMSSEEVTAWVEDRVRAHEAAKLSLPTCTDEERWSRPTYAVMKGLNDAKAFRVFDTLPEAQAFIAASTAPLVLVARPGSSIRCMRYCPVREFCSQARALLPTPIGGDDGNDRVWVKG